MIDSANAGRKLWILICCYFIFSFFASLILGLQPLKPFNQSAKLLLSLYSVTAFLLPVLVLRKLYWSKDSSKIFTNTHRWNLQTIILSISAMICCIVVMNWLGYVNEQLPIWSSLKEAEIKEQENMKLYMKMNSVFLLLYNLLIFSVVPSFCEEIFFRSAMQPLWVKSTGREWLAILITATIFSFLHFQLSGFLPRLFAGIVLGVIFLFSNNILLTIICHFIYNSSIVGFSYAEQHSTFRTDIFQQQLLNPYLVLSAIVLMIALLLQLRKTTLRVA